MTARPAAPPPPAPGFELWDGPPDRPLPDHAAVDPPFRSRAQELAQAFREAVSVAHGYGEEHPHPFEAKPHRLIEDADYNCDNSWCVRFWEMVREAEDTARALVEQAPDLTELRRLAEAAAPMWEQGRELTPGEALRFMQARDAFRAAANPATILRLLDLLAEKSTP